MSYCRCGDDSDVYVLGSIMGHWEITVCGGKGYYKADTREDALSKLLQLREEGYKIPSSAIQRLENEIGNNHHD